MEELKDHIRAKRILGISIMILLLLPILSQFLPWVKFQKLGGYVPAYEQPELKVDNWFDGSYQVQMNKYVENQLKIRPALVRLHNETKYRLFDEIDVESTVVGKEGYLFEQDYIISYQGGDYKGYVHILEKVKKLSLISKALNERGVDLMLVLTPGKAALYPEYIADSLRYQNSTTNYETYTHFLAQTDIHVLDFMAWFKQLKDTIRYPLFPKNGTHWSSYGEVLAGDSIGKYVEALRGVKLKPLVIDSIEVSTDMRDRDQDIEDAFNLISDLEDLPMAYPSYRFVADTAATSVNLVSIADSYYWGLYNKGFSYHWFGESKFMYYFYDVYPDNYSKRTTINDIDIKAELEKRDVVMLLCTETNLRKFAFGFIDKVYELYYGDASLISPEDEIKIQQLVDSLQTDPKQMLHIQKQAHDIGISIEKALRENAIYILGKRTEAEYFLN